MLAPTAAQNLSKPAINNSNGNTDHFRQLPSHLDPRHAHEENKWLARMQAQARPPRQLYHDMSTYLMLSILYWLHANAQQLKMGSLYMHATRTTLANIRANQPHKSEQHTKDPHTCSSELGGLIASNSNMHTCTCALLGLSMHCQNCLAWSIGVQYTCSLSHCT